MKKDRIYGNKEISREFTKNDAPLGDVGDKVIYRVPADVYFGKTQKEADRKAEADVEANGQGYANEHGGYSLSYWMSSEVCGDFVKNDCDSGEGSSVKVCVEPGRFVSFVSQADADAKAKEELGRIGQSEANAMGSCCQYFLSYPLRGEFYKDDCLDGTKCRFPVVYELPAGAVVSYISQIEANEEAYSRFIKEGQEKANAEGTCEAWYENDVVGEWFTRECEFGYKADPVYYSVPAGTVGSFVSKEDANSKAMEIVMREGPSYAKMNTECYKWIENIDWGEDCFW